MNLDNLERAKNIKTTIEKLNDHLSDVKKMINAKREPTSIHLNSGGEILVLSQPNMPIPIKDFLYLYEQSLNRQIKKLTSEAFDL